MTCEFSQEIEGNAKKATPTEQASVSPAEKFVSDGPDMYEEFCKTYEGLTSKGVLELIQAQAVERVTKGLRGK